MFVIWANPSLFYWWKTALTLQQHITALQGSPTQARQSLLCGGWTLGSVEMAMLQLQEWGTQSAGASTGSAVLVCKTLACFTWLIVGAVVSRWGRLYSVRNHGATTTLPTTFPPPGISVQKTIIRDIFSFKLIITSNNFTFVMSLRSKAINCKHSKHPSFRKYNLDIISKLINHSWKAEAILLLN